MEERIKKAFDFASDSTKQLITLSTGIVTLTITFGKDVFQNVPFYAKVLLVIAWVIYLLSIIFGILTLLSLTGTLEPVPDPSAAAGGGGRVPPLPLGDVPAGASAVPEPSIRHGTITGFSILQILTFLGATILIVVIGFASISTDRASSSSSGGDSKATEQHIRELQHGLVEALTKRDGPLLDQTFADDC